MDWKTANLNRFKDALNRIDEWKKVADASLKNGKLTEEQHNDAMTTIAESRNMYKEFLDKAEQIANDPTITVVMKGE